MTHPPLGRRLGVLGAAALVLLSSSCGLSGTTTGSSPDGGTGACGAPAGNADDQPISGEVKGEIKFVTQGLKADFAGFFEPLIKKFETEHPGTTVKWEDSPADATDARMIADAANCALADVINAPLPTMKALTDAGALMAIDKKLPGVGAAFVPTVWDSSALGKDGAHTALPWYWGPQILTFNKKIFKEAGLDPAKPPATVQEYFAAARQIAEKAPKGTTAFWGNPRWQFIPDWHGMKVKAMNDDLSAFTFADDPNAQAWFQGYADGYQSGAISKDSITGEPDPSQTYIQGKLAFGSANASFLRTVKDNAPTVYEDTGVAPAPREPGARTFLNAQFITVNKSTKHPAAALEFAKFVTSPESQLAWAKDPKVVIFPTTAESLKDPFFSTPSDGGPFGEARAVAAKEALEAEAWLPAIYLDNSAVANAILGQLQLAMQGKVGAAEAIRAAQDEANKLLKTIKG
ncbi:extracellular solute-binding protein [Nonomuraea wenchangensis]